jgi:Flp pilus assembly protein TadG
MPTPKIALLILRKLWQFAAARDGNVAITFALAVIPLIGFVGTAVDYSRANATKAVLQEALDATALMLSKEAAKDTSAQLQTNAQNYFLAQFMREQSKYAVANVTVNANFSSSGGTSVVINASAQVPTTFLSIVGYNNITVGSSSTVKWGTARLRVALVLDNTGSMAQSGKMAALQTATKNLLTQLQNAAVSSDDVYVSIIPFVKDVNVDSANSAAPWIDWTDWDSKNGTCSGGSGGSNGSSNGSKQVTQSTCGGTWKSKNHNTWNGCVQDRGDDTQPNPANYDTTVDAPNTSIPATLYSAEQYSSCPQAAMGLSYDWAAMTKEVDKMSPAGNTNQAIGLQLGWMSLVGGGPFTAPAMQTGYTYNQIIILLTDGLNTQDRWYKSQSEIDARQTMTCDNIKASGVILYTVEVSTDGTPVSPLLQNCASDSSKFFYLTSANDIVTTFDQIGTNLSKLYVAK